jgi:hypothetical protein
MMEVLVKTISVHAKLSFWIFILRFSAAVEDRNLDGRYSGHCPYPLVFQREFFQAICFS